MPAKQFDDIIEAEIDVVLPKLLSGEVDVSELRLDEEVLQPLAKSAGP